MSKAMAVLCGIAAVTAIAASAPDRAKENLAKLKSSDPDARDQAVYFFRRMAAKGLPLPEELTSRDLEAYVAGWEWCSDEAVLLLGRLGDKSSVPFLKARRSEAEQMARRRTDHRIQLARRVRRACLKALLRLQDEDAIREVRSLFGSDEVEDRVQAIECLVYAETKALVPLLVPLLDDKRNAVEKGVAGSGICDRVCDLAVNALSDVGGIDVPFAVNRWPKYSDDELAEMRRAAPKNR